MVIKIIRGFCIRISYHSSLFFHLIKSLGERHTTQTEIVLIRLENRIPIQEKEKPKTAQKMNKDRGARKRKISEKVRQWDLITQEAV